MQPVRTLQRELQANFQPDRPQPLDYRLDQQFLARMVGYVALGLPLFLIQASWIGLPFGESCDYDSISHFYYSQFYGDVLVIALAFIGTFLIAYRGENRNESRLATAAGLFALGVALFPTSGPGCDRESFAARVLVDLPLEAEPLAEAAADAAPRLPERFFLLFDGVDILHFGSAGLLFAFLAFYSFVVFTRVKPGVHMEGARMRQVKRARNAIYYASGTVIVLAMLGMLVFWLRVRFVGPWTWWTDHNLTFLSEAAALIAFGVAWMVKGRTFRNLLRDPDERV